MIFASKSEFWIFLEIIKSTNLLNKIYTYIFSLKNRVFFNFNKSYQKMLYRKWNFTHIQLIFMLWLIMLIFHIRLLFKQCIPFFGLITNFNHYSNNPCFEQTNILEYMIVIDSTSNMYNFSKSQFWDLMFN